MFFCLGKTSSMNILMMKVQFVTLLILFNIFNCIAQGPPPPPPPPQTLSSDLLPIATQKDAYTFTGLDELVWIIAVEDGYKFYYLETDKQSGFTFETIKQQREFINRTLTWYDSNQKYYIISKGKQKGLVDKKGSLLIDMNYSSLSAYTAKKNGKRGVVNFENEEIIPFIYDGLQSCARSSRLIAKIDTLYGILDSVGNQLIPIEYAYLNECNRSYYTFSTESVNLIHKENTFGVLDSNNRIVIPESYRKIEHLTKDAFIIETPSKKVGIYQAGEGYLIQPVYDLLEETTFPFVLIAQQENSFVVLNIYGEKLSELAYDSMEEKLTILKVSKNGKFGFLAPTNGKYEEATELIFDTLDDFSLTRKMHFTVGEQSGYLTFDSDSNTFNVHWKNQRK